MDKIEVTNGTVDPDHYGPIGDAARGIASYCDDPQRVHVYTAAFDAIKDILANRTDATPVAVESVAELQLSAFLAGRGSIRTKDNGRTHESSLGPTMDDYRRMARTALAKGQADATPVAWMYTRKPDAWPAAPDVIVEVSKRWPEDDEARPFWTETPLYTQPPATDVAALVEALRFYAGLLSFPYNAWVQPSVVDYSKGGDGHHPDGPPIPSDTLLIDGGKHARQALAPFTKGQP